MPAPDAARPVPVRTLWLLLALLLLAPGCATFWQGLTPQGPPAATESARRLEPGPWKVGRADLRLVDASRPTPAHGGTAALPSRTLETSVWFSKDADGPSPLVIYSHGFLSERQEAAYLAKHLASHGYLVVSPDFPLSRRGAPGGPTAIDVVHQPGDVSFLIDWALGRHEPGGPPRPFAGAADPERIAAVGLSLGGLTSTLVAFHPLLRDPRVRAAVSIAGPVSFFTRRLFQTAPVPFLMIASRDDAIIDYEANGAVLLELAPRAVRLELAGASHAGFAGISSRVFRFWPNPDSVGCWYLERHLDLDPEDVELRGLGGPEQGVDLRDAELPACDAPTWRRAMRPRRQHLLTTLAVRAFLDAELGATAEQRAAGRRYLMEVMPRELDDVELGARR
ncbi:MAG: CocE/NonD family hydrolase [Myxococcota bacterium]|nr:CocE/NonD family hydrolase [Myxococcota bacterium]